MARVSQWWSEVSCSHHMIDDWFPSWAWCCLVGSQSIRALHYACRDHLDQTLARALPQTLPSHAIFTNRPTKWTSVPISPQFKIGNQWYWPEWPEPGGSKSHIGPTVHHHSKDPLLPDYSACNDTVLSLMICCDIQSLLIPFVSFWRQQRRFCIDRGQLNPTVVTPTLAEVEV